LTGWQKSGIKGFADLKHTTIKVQKQYPFGRIFRKIITGVYRTGKPRFHDGNIVKIVCDNRQWDRLADDSGLR